MVDVDPDLRQDAWTIEWTRPRARAFQLLEVLRHEGPPSPLARPRRAVGRRRRAEAFATAYARRKAGLVWPRYVGRVGLG